MIYQIAVCDDQEADRAYLSALVREWAEQNGLFLRIDLFPSAEAFLFHYAENKAYDILLLDIEMGGENGVDLAKTIRKGNKRMQIVFVTGYSDYIAEGYEVSALHYLMKPVHREKLFSVLNRAKEKIHYQGRAPLLEASGETVRIPLHEIRYLEVNQNYVTIHAERDYTVKKTLKELEKELDPLFFRTGRSFILNVNYIRRVTRTDVYLMDGTCLPLPRGVYDSLNRAIIQNT